jgi:nitric oxide dioxygenase
MLHDRTIKTVKTTAPIRRERGVDITRRMYEILFQDEHIILETAVGSAIFR